MACRSPSVGLSRAITGRGVKRPSKDSCSASMAQLFYFLPYITSFVFGLNGDPFFWAVALTLVSIPLHLWMRAEGHDRYGMPIEDWSLPSGSLLVFGQLLIHATLYGFARVLVVLGRGVGLV